MQRNATLEHGHCDEFDVATKPEVASAQTQPVMSSSSSSSARENPLVVLEHRRPETPAALTPFIGPPEPQKLHRFSLWLKLVHLLGSLWLLSGTSLYATIALCIIVHIAYFAFVSAGAYALVITAFAVYALYMFRMLKTFLHTSVRLWMRLIRCKFAYDGKGIFTFPVVDRLAARWNSLLRKRGWIQNDDSDDNSDNQYYPFTKHALYTLCLMVIIALPFILIASIYGLWVVVTWIFFTFTIGSSVYVLAVNLFCRLVRVTKFVFLIYNGIPRARRQAIYVASSLQEKSAHILDLFATRCALLLIFVMITSAVTSLSAQLWLIIPCSIAAIICIALRFRALILSRTRLQHIFGKKHQYSEYYDGESIILPILILIGKTLLLGFGMFSVAHLDISDIREQSAGSEFKPSFLKDIKNEIAGESTKCDLMIYLTAYLVTYFIQDLALICPGIPDRIRAGSFTIIMLGHIAIAILMRFTFPGFISTTVMLAVFLSIDLRDGKHFWTSKGLHRGDKSYQYATINAIITVVIIIGTVFLSSAIGYIVEADNLNQEDLSSIDFTQQKLDLTSTYSFCYTRQTNLTFSIVDITTIAGSAYMLNKTSALAFVETNPSLKKANLTLTGNFNHTAGVRFLEYHHDDSNTSIFAIRGTSSFEDILQDMYLWSTPSLLSMSTYVGTFIQLWPRKNIADLVNVVQNYGTYSNIKYYEEVTLEVEKRKKEGVNIIVTGHSLGGGLAMVIGAKVGVPALGISAPGLGLSFKSFEVKLDNIARWTMNVVPFNDPVPKFDEQVGTIINIPCNSKIPSRCHRWRVTLKKLIDSCGVY